MKRHLCTVAWLAALTATPAAAQVLISDSFETDSSSNYTVWDDGNAPSGDGGADSTTEFAFDYVTAGIPLAPRSAPGDTSGLRFTANAREEGDEGPSGTEEDHVTAFHNTTITGSHRLDVDVYLGVEAASGTTEYVHVGVAGTPTDINSLFNPIVGSGHFIAFNGDGDSSSDYRHSTPSTLAVPFGDPSYLNTGNQTQSFADTYLELFPNTANPGSPTNIWTTLTITATPAAVTYWLDGTAIISTAPELIDGSVSLGYADLFDSVGPHFAIYDNLVVTAIPEPSALLLCLGAAAALMSRKRRV